METFISGLLLATISALTFLAYKHPKGYKNLSPLVYFIWGLAFASLMTWCAATQIISASVSGLIASDKKQEYLAIMGKFDLPFILIMGGGMAFLVYLLLLDILPRIIHDADDKKPN